MKLQFLRSSFSIRILKQDVFLQQENLQFDDYSRETPIIILVFERDNDEREKLTLIQVWSDEIKRF
jgi:hypothetical protein